MSGDPILRPDGRIAFTCGLRLTLQRTFEEDWTADGNNPPRSYGRLAFTQAPDGAGFAIPILSAENVWIGLEAPDPPEILEITTRAQRGAEAVTRTSPPDHALKGIAQAGRYRAIAAGDVLRLSIKSKVSGLSCDLRLIACRAEEILDSDTFTRLEKLNRSLGYSGVHLP